MLLSGGIRIDQYRIHIQTMLVELIRNQHGMYGRLDRAIFQINRGFLIGMHLFIEQKIQTRTTRNDFKHLLQTDIFEFDRDRFFIGVRQHRFARCGGSSDSDSLLQFFCLRICWIFCQ